MLRHGVPADEIAATLGVAGGDLVTRRWAMLELMTAAPERLESRRFGETVQAMRTASSPSAITSPG
jgi:hypothetical protein